MAELVEARSGRDNWWSVWRRRRWVPLLLVALVAAGIAGAVSLRMKNAAYLNPESVSAVARGNLLISVTESGSLEAERYVEIVSEVEGQTTIVSIVPEGTSVNEGDLLVRLDSSQVEERLTQQDISFQSAQASYIKAKEDQQILENQTQSDITNAELNQEFAEIDLRKYVEGDWPQQQRQATADVTIAQEELNRARDRRDWTVKLYEKGYVTRSEFEADEFAVTKATLKLQQAEEASRLLEEYTHPKDLKRLEAEREEAKRELDRVKHRAASQLAQAQADLEARRSTFDLQKSRLEKLRDQMSKTVIRAPQPGLVVYASSGGRSPFSQSLVEQGASVRERQAILRLPDVRSMQAVVKIHESAVDKVRVGQQAWVTVDAFPDRVLHGRVTRVAILPDAQSSWMNPDLKVYSTNVVVDEQLPDLKPGMSAKVQIVVASLKDVLYVPMPAVFRVGADNICYVKKGGRTEPRPVKVGLENDKFVEIKEGLAEGEEVLLQAPPGARTAAEEVEQEVPELEERPPSTQPGEVPVEQPAVQPSPEGREGMMGRWQQMTPEEREAARERTRSQMEAGRLPDGREMTEEMRQRILQRTREGPPGEGPREGFGPRSRREDASRPQETGQESAADAGAPSSGTKEKAGSTP